MVSFKKCDAEKFVKIEDNLEKLRNILIKLKLDTKMPRYSRSRSRSRSRKHKKSGSRTRSPSRDRSSRYRDYRDHRSRDRSRDRHKSTKKRDRSKKRKKHSRDRHRHYSSSRSRSRSKSKSVKTTNNSKKYVQHRSRSKSITKPEPQFVMEKYNFSEAVSVLDRGKEAIDEINKDEFVPKAFTTSNSTATVTTAKKLPEKVKIDLKNETITLPPIEAQEPQDPLIHPNFFGDPEERMQKWIRKLWLIRQKQLNSQNHL